MNKSSNDSFKTIFMQELAVWAGCLLYFGIYFLAFAQLKMCTHLYNTGIEGRC